MRLQLRLRPKSSTGGTWDYSGQDGVIYLAK